MYTTAIDIWALGCCFAEMLWGKVLFCGSDSIDQLCMILKARGSPSDEELLGLNPDLDLEGGAIAIFRNRNPLGMPWAKLLGQSAVSSNTSGLLDAPLTCNPTQRP